MKKLKNWDNKTWLSSKSYISKFNKFLKTKINLNKNSKILDIGCGRANIISTLHKKYKFKNKPTGIDIVAGKADILLVPNVEAGNALVKMMIYFMGACAAGVVVGGKVPVVITSRADDVQARLASMAAAVVAL